MDPVLATVVAAVAGLCVGSFLNVVIHRLPKMLERGWEAQCAELRGETVASGGRLQPRRAALGVPHVRHADHRAREHPGRVVARARRQMHGLQDADFGALSDRRDPGRTSGGGAIWQLRRDATGHRRLRAAVDAARAHDDRLRHAAPAGRHHAAAAVGRTHRQSVGHVHAARTTPSSARSPATCRCGRSTGCSS